MKYSILVYQQYYREKFNLKTTIFASTIYLTKYNFKGFFNLNHIMFEFR